MPSTAITRLVVYSAVVHRIQSAEGAENWVQKHGTTWGNLLLSVILYPRLFLEIKFRHPFTIVGSTINFRVRASFATICFYHVVINPTIASCTIALYIPRSVRRQYLIRPRTPRCGRSSAPAGRAGSGWQQSWLPLCCVWTCPLSPR